MTWQDPRCAVLAGRSGAALRTGSEGPRPKDCDAGLTGLIAFHGFVSAAPVARFGRSINASGIKRCLRRIDRLLETSLGGSPSEGVHDSRIHSLQSPRNPTRRQTVQTWRSALVRRWAHVQLARLHRSAVSLQQHQPLCVSWRLAAEVNHRFAGAARQRVVGLRRDPVQIDEAGSGPSTGRSGRCTSELATGWSTNSSR